MIPLNLVIKTELFERIHDGYMQSPFKNRLEFIRYLLDSAITEWERQRLNSGVENDA